MIVVDTSALMAVLLAEPEAGACMRILEREREILMSALTLSEALIVSSQRRLPLEMRELIDGLGIEIAPVTEAGARAAAEAYAMWGKGIHPAGLNFGDCFAYALARERGAKLLFVGEDFSRTDVQSAL